MSTLGTSFASHLHSYRPLACALVFGLVASAGSVARAADPRAQQDLEQAEQALANLDYDAANKGANRVVQMHGLSHDQLVRAYRVLANTDAVLDKEAAAREAFQLLLTYDPNFVGDANLGPKVQAPFMEARGFIRAQPSQPGVDAAVTLHANEAGTLRVTTHDPTHAGKKMVAAYRWGGEGPFQTTPLPVSEVTTVDVAAPPAGTTRLDYYVEVLDDRDSVVFESGNPAAPKTATVAVEASPTMGANGESTEQSHSVFASPIFWTVVGVVVVGAGTGIYFATKKSTTDETLPPTSATLAPVLKCGTTGC